MGTSSRGSSQSRSRSPREPTGRTNHTIPEIFRTQRPNRAAPLPASTPSQELTGILLTPTDPHTPHMENDGTSLRQPSLRDLQAVAADIKDTLFSAISDLRHELQAISGRMQRVEEDVALQGSATKATHHKVNSHTMQLRDLQRHVEDLDNRGRRHNLRVRGLPETVEQDQLLQVVTGLFNQLLDRPRPTPVDMERIHRALRPRGRDADPPRDVICYVNDYLLKEDILKKTRDKPQMEYEGSHIYIYQDLSAITLRHRRDLRPLLDVLRNNGIRYRWKFPFALSASHQGRSALLRVPEDLDGFCRTLDIPLVSVPHWYEEFNILPHTRHPPAEEPMDAHNTSFRRRRSPTPIRRYSSEGPRHPPPSPMTAPLPRRARRDR